MPQKVVLNLLLWLLDFRWCEYRQFSDLTDTFSVPKCPKKRLYSNVLYYRSNYILFAAGTLWELFGRQWAVSVNLCVFGAIAGFWHQAGPTLLTHDREQAVKLVGWSFGVAMLTLIATGVFGPLLNALCVGAAISLLHAFSRRTNIKNKVNRYKSHVKAAFSPSRDSGD